MAPNLCTICHDYDERFGRPASSKVFCVGGCGRCYHKRCMRKVVHLNDTGFCVNCRQETSSSVASGRGQIRLETLMDRLKRLEAKLDAGFAGRLPSRNHATTSNELSKNPPAYDSVIKDAGGPSKFPPKVWTNIFQKLNATQLANARLVCRRWNQIIGHSPTLVDKLVLNFPRGTVLTNNCAPIQTLTSSTKLRHTRATFQELTIVGAATWWPSIGKNLHTLTLINCKVSIDMLLEMLKATTALKRLSLTCGENLFFRTLPEVTFTMQYLEHLILANIRHVEILDIFKQICPLLKTLKLPGENRNDEFVVAAIRFIWAAQNTLEELELAGEPGELWDRISEAIGMQLRRVKVVAGALDEMRLARLCETFPTVEGLMTPTSRVTDKVLTTIGANLCKLKYLDITLSSSDSPDDLSFLKSMPELRTLALRCAFPAVGFGNLKHANLESLSLRGVEQGNGVGGHWFAHFPNLRSVALTDCTVESWSDLFVPVVTQLKKLAHLSLVGIKVRNAGSEYLPDYLAQLTTLRLAGCDLSKDSLIMLFTLCPRLTRIFLQDMAGVDDEVTLAICQYVRELQQIRVVGCAGLTDQCLEYLWNYYEELDVVEVVDCVNISKEALEQTFA
ncbi:uncharacterized protein LOC119766689 [Culex quinquefasciatus]|uniref:uncharacterized protein LOC119766689 n=1 Tax=Culex quinquefasciatus TaxID=7176 RepID=UPI0018E3D2A9|nr:uncharacterized protein LOC119766689 [Culex quinquefasciatus]